MGTKRPLINGDEVGIRANIMRNFWSLHLSPICNRRKRKNSLEFSYVSFSVRFNSDAIKVKIYDDGADGWILEVVDKQRTSTVWDDPFPADAVALAEDKKTLMKKSVQSLIGEK